MKVEELDKEKKKILKTGLSKILDIVMYLIYLVGFFFVVFFEESTLVETLLVIGVLLILTKVIDLDWDGKERKKS
jgi:uncharacterized membrane protein YqjE